MSQLCKVGHWHDKKHYPTSWDLLLINLSPYLSQTQLVVSGDECSTPLHLSAHLDVYTFSKTPAALQKAG